jgi:mRNA interferase HicA
LVNADELIRMIRKTGRRDGIAVEIVRNEPKGGHVMVYYGDRKAPVPIHGSAKELGKGLVAAILKRLGLRLTDLG